MKYKYNPETGLVYGKGGKPIHKVNSNGYLLASRNGKIVPVHRLIYELIGIDIPDGMEVDHVNHIRTDNRWSNLRLVTKSDNQKNLPMFKSNTSGVTGVGWHKKSSRWRAYISVDGKPIHLGSFAEFHLAVDARKLAEVAYGYHENHGKDVA